jgi:hypothetical protein
MSIGQWFSLGALVVIAPHMSRDLARFAACAFILCGVFGPSIVEWMSK